MKTQHWIWFQFQAHKGKTPATDGWATAHLYPVDASGDPKGTPPLCSVMPSSFRPWDSPRVVRPAPPRARLCGNCARLLHHARDEHGGDLEQVADPANWPSAGRWRTRPSAPDD
jgi:hypothetical protein